MAWISKTGLLTSSEMEKRKANANYWFSSHTNTPTPRKGIPKELIAILSSKRGLHKL